MMHQHLKEATPTIPIDLVSVAEAAEISTVTCPAVWRLIRAGHLRARGVHRSYRISLSELLAPVAVRGKDRE